MAGLFMDGGSPYLQRKDRLLGRASGRPVGTGVNGKTKPYTEYDPSTARPELLGGGIGTTGQITGQVQQPTTSTGSGIAGSVAQSPYAGFLQGLTKPITDPYKSQFKEKANLLREYTQGAYGTAAEGMRQKMAGGQGLRMGESGIADTAVGRIQKAGAEELSRGYQGLMSEESQRQQQSAQETAGLNLQRMLGGGGMALTGEEGALNRQMEYYRSKLGAEQAQWQPYWYGMSSGY